MVCLIVWRCLPHSFWSMCFRCVFVTFKNCVCAILPWATCFRCVLSFISKAVISTRHLKVFPCFCSPPLLLDPQRLYSTYAAGYVPDGRTRFSKCCIVQLRWGRGEESDAGGQGLVGGEVISNYVSAGQCLHWLCTLKCSKDGKYHSLSVKKNSPLWKFVLGVDFKWRWLRWFSLHALTAVLVRVWLTCMFFFGKLSR